MTRGATSLRPRPSASVDAASLRRVLLRLPNWLGDVCFVAPSVAALHRAAPKATLVAACREPLASLASRLPGVSETVVLSERGGLRAPLAAARAIRAAGCDAAVVFPRSLRAALSVAVARVPVRVGFASDARTAFLTHPVRGWKPLRLAHRSEYFGSLLAPFGLPPPSEPWTFEPPADALRWADEFLARAPGRRPRLPIVAFEPAGAYGVAKRWPEDRYAALAGRLVREEIADVVVVGTAAMRPVEERIAAAAGAPLIRAAGATDLPQLAALLARSRLLVTNDTGPMHLAAAVGTPLLALFGSTDPAVCGPRGRAPTTVLYEKVDCSPCYLEECPVPGHPCLDRFSVDRVFDAAKAMLARRARRSRGSESRSL